MSGAGVEDVGPVVLVAQGPIFVNVWRSTPEAHHLHRVRDAQLAAHRANGKLGVVTVLSPRSIPRMDEATRRASADLRRELHPTFASSAFVIDGDGFLASISRSLLSGVHLLMPADHPTRVFADVLVASAWTAEHVSGVTPEEVAGLVQRARFHAGAE